MHWCDYCQDDFAEDHDMDLEGHKVGRTYGPVGRDLAIMRDLRQLCDDNMLGDEDLSPIYPSVILDILDREEDK